MYYYFIELFFFFTVLHPKVISSPLSDSQGKFSSSQGSFNMTRLILEKIKTTNFESMKYFCSFLSDNTNSDNLPTFHHVVCDESEQLSDLIPDICIRIQFRNWQKQECNFI